MKNSLHKSIFGVLLLAAMSTAQAQKGLPAKVPTQATVNTFFPEHVDYKPSLLSNLVVPAGFTVSPAASGLGKPRMMAMTADGKLYVTRRDVGDVLLLEDKDGDGKFESLKTVWAKFTGVHGIALKDGWLYLCSAKMLKRGKIASDGSLTDTAVLIRDLPEGSQHDNRILRFGPDNLLYISVGSSCNDCGETNAEYATLLQVQPDWSRKIFARGLRNTIGFDWSATGEIWGIDNATDWRGDEIPPEELNTIRQDGDYGWPRVYGKQQVDETREDPQGSTKEAYAKTTVPSIMEFPAHSAPIDFHFLSKATAFPADYRDDALVCWHGSWNRKNPEGYKVQRIKFENGRPTGVEDFFSGFLSADKKTRFGRPAGMVISTKSEVFISDDESGVIYRVAPVR